MAVVLRLGKLNLQCCELKRQAHRKGRWPCQTEVADRIHDIIHGPWRLCVSSTDQRGLDLPFISGQGSAGGQKRWEDPEESKNWGKHESSFSFEHASSPHMDLYTEREPF